LRVSLERLEEEATMTEAAHRQHDSDVHEHRHGPDCGHEAVQHGDHVDYLHDGHRHAEHAEHYDEHDDS
jgi:hypothetical protein